MMRDPYEVFVSNSRDDRPRADSLFESLRDAGFTPVRADESIRPVDSWTEVLELEEVIRRARGVVLLISSSHPPSHWQLTEWRVADEECWKDRSKRLVPVVLGDGELPSFLSDRQVIRITDIEKQWPQAVREAIRALKGEKPRSGRLVSTEVEDPARRRDRLKYIEDVARAMKQE